jgi:hypothetical protein
MRQRKLQIFISSTYEDLVDIRLAAFEAVLAAGHIPAAMEQFTPGDETAWEKIRSWIDESDAFILILGGRYGSIEPTSQKSYVHREYEYASEKRKPYFALVVKKEHHEERVKQLGLKVDEREHQEKYKQFYQSVTAKLCAFWSDKKDVQASIFRKLPEWSHRADLSGWIRAEEAPSLELASEVAKLSQENRELRQRVSESTSKEELFDGLRFDELVRILREASVPNDLRSDLYRFEHTFGGPSITIDHVGHLWERFMDEVATPGSALPPSTAKCLFANGLAEAQSRIYEDRGIQLIRCQLTEMGRRFRNRLRAFGPQDARVDQLWRGTASQTEEASKGSV